MKRRTLACSLLAIASIAALAAYGLAERRNGPSLSARLEQIVPVTRHREISCAEVAASHPLVLLALGQSNAGNHGSPPSHAREPLTLIAEGKCIKASDPLPGGTGTGGSIWQRLPAELAMQKYPQPVVLSVIAVDATTIDDWTDPLSPLGKRLNAHVASMRRLGLAPALALWQQGEADARIGTGANGYASGLSRLATALSEAGATAPIILARSTVCRSAPNTLIRSAIESIATSDRRFRLGPDTDTLSSGTFRNGCHLTSDGLDSAAKLWAAAIIGQASTINPARFQ